ncbi:MAG TPA: hypothetical protein VMV90_07350 [Rectinemataceae bacterium]|nr:hypothetical protein [Rectinemataceae bacterium]
MNSSLRVAPLLALGLALLAAPLAAPLAAQSAGTAPGADQTPAQSPDNVDNLFDQGAVIPKATVPAAAKIEEVQDSRLHFFSSLNLYGDAGFGYKAFPPASDLSQHLGLEGGASFSALLGVEVRPADEMRLRLAMEYDFPPASGTAPALQVSELFVDYSFLNTVFFRVGVFNYGWGNSQFFQLGDLPSRGLPGWSTSLTPLWQKTNLITNTSTVSHPVSFKAYVPFEKDGFTFLGRADLANYGFPNTSSPDPRYMGLGLLYDLVTGPVEWNIGGFTQYLLHPRGLLTAKTSAFGFDLSAEAVVAFPYHLMYNNIASDIPSGGGIYVGGEVQRIYPSFVFGIGRDWADAGIKLYAEYAYNGERDGSTYTNWLDDETGPGGHNSAFTVKFDRLGQSNVGLNLLWQQNWSDGSCMIAPFIQLNAAALTTIQIGLPMVFGPDNSEVMNNRLLPGSQRLGLLLLIKVSDNYRN